MTLLTLYDFDIYDLSKERITDSDEKNDEQIIEYGLKEILPKDIKTALINLTDTFDVQTSLKNLYVFTPNLNRPINVDDLKSSNDIDFTEFGDENMLYLEFGSDFDLNYNIISSFLQLSESDMFSKFYVCGLNSEEQMLVQGFYQGEYDTGYFSQGCSNEYIIEFDGDEPFDQNSGLIYPSYESFLKAIGVDLLTN